MAPKAKLQTLLTTPEVLVVIPDDVPEEADPVEAEVITVDDNKPVIVEELSVLRDMVDDDPPLLPPLFPPLFPPLLPPLDIEDNELIEEEGLIEDVDMELVYSMEDE